MKARGATTSGVSVSKEVSGKSPESDFCWLGKLEILDIGAFETLGYVRGGKNGNGERHLSLSKMGCEDEIFCASCKIWCTQTIITFSNGLGWGCGLDHRHPRPKTQV